MAVTEPMSVMFRIHVQGQETFLLVDLPIFKCLVGISSQALEISGFVLKL